MPSIKPILKLTTSQYRRLMEREVLRQPGQAARIAPRAMERGMEQVAGPSFNVPGEIGMPRRDLLTGGMDRVPLVRPNPTTQGIPTSIQRMGASSAVDEVMATEAPRTRVMSRLRQQEEGVPFSEPTPIEKDYPYIEARLRYLKNPASEENPGGYVPVNAAMRGYKRLRGVVPGSAEDMTGAGRKGLSYEQIKFKSVETPFEQKARRIAQEPAMSKASLPEILSTVQMLERMWQGMGGKRSITGKTWKRLQEGSSLKGREIDVRDYFIRSGLKWREDPVKFSRQWPREAKLLTAIWDEASQGVK